MKLSIQEKKILYAFACPNHHNTVTRLKWLTALTVDPKAKRWMLGLARKMENEVEEHWYPCFYQQLRMEMEKYYKYPLLCRLERSTTEGSVTYVIEKSRLSIRLVPPYSEERLAAAREYAKQHGFQVLRTEKESA